MIRYYLTDAENLTTFFSLNKTDGDIRTSYSVTGGDIAPIITKKGLVLAKWGFVSTWAPRVKKPFRIYVAQAETLAHRYSFSYAFSHSRCVIPVNHLYISEKEKGVNATYSIRPTKGFLSVAGVYLEYKGKQDTYYEFVMITVPAQKGENQPKKRLPAILAKGSVESWLDSSQNDTKKLSEILGSYPSKNITTAKSEASNQASP